MSGRIAKADVVCTLNDENSDYLRLWISPKNGTPMVFRISRGTAEALSLELSGGLAQTGPTS